MEPRVSIFENFEFDKYYKIISPSGLIFALMGVAFHDTKITQFGILTFLYGIWAWMIGVGFHIKADIHLEKFKARNFIWIFSGIYVLSFVIYLILTYFTFF